MRHYQLMARELLQKTGTQIALRQRQSLYASVRADQFHKRTQLLENELNRFFYDPYNRNQDFQQVMEIAQEQYKQKWQQFEIDPKNMSAKLANASAAPHFVNKNADLQEIKSVAANLASFFSGTQKEAEVLSLTKRIARLRKKNSKTWKIVSNNVNALVASALYGNKTVYGDAFEIPLAVYSKMLRNKANDEVAELGEILVGGKRSHTTVDLSKLAPQDRAQFQPSGTQRINEGLAMRYNASTPDKVDVILEMNDEAFNISAKSYSSIYDQIRILGGTSLVVPLLNLTSVDFGSAYLSALFYGEKMADYHHTLKIAILLMALTGQGTGQSDMADVVVLNHKQKQRIYVRNIASIIATVAKNNNLKYVHFTKDSTEIPDSAVHNYYKLKMGQNASLSIPSMLTELAQQKLVVSLKGTLIRDAVVSKK